MKQIFADTFYWIALTDSKDEWHSSVKKVTLSLGNFRIVTTDEVIGEFLNHFSEKGRFWRDKSVTLVKAIQSNSNITVVPQTRQSFLDGLKMYQERGDKGYSFVDCVSMNTMRERGLTEILTHDHHFTQEGFTILLTDKAE